MKNLFFVLAFILPLGLFAQDDKPYYQLEMITMTPDYTKLASLSDVMEAHNKKYHPPGTYQAAVFNITAGPNAGRIIWSMGPTTYTEMDARPSEDGHDEDWANNVMPHIKKMHQSEIWRRNADMVIDNREEGNVAPFNLYVIRYLTVANGQGHRISGLMEKVKKTLSNDESVNYWAVYVNQFIQGAKNGRHLAAVTGMNSWSEFDEDGMNFRNAFEKIYGEGSYNDFSREMEDVFENSWHEIWTLNKKMSGMQ